MEELIFKILVSGAYRFALELLFLVANLLRLLTDLDSLGKERDEDDEAPC